MILIQTCSHRECLCRMYLIGCDSAILIESLPRAISWICDLKTTFTILHYFKLKNWVSVNLESLEIWNYCPSYWNIFLLLPLVVHVEQTHLWDSMFSSHLVDSKLTQCIGFSLSMRHPQNHHDTRILTSASADRTGRAVVLSVVIGQVYSQIPKYIHWSISLHSYYHHNEK